MRLKFCLALCSRDLTAARSAPVARPISSSGISSYSARMSGLPLQRRQLRYGARDDLRAFESHQVDRAAGRDVVFQLVLGPIAAKLVEGEIPRHSDQKTAERSAFRNVDCGTSPQQEKRILHNILRRLSRSGHPARKPVQHVLMLPVDLPIFRFGHA
jgi:hypothetical protein